MIRFIHWLLDRRVVVPGNLVRFRLFAVPGTRSWRIYLHHFIGPDPDHAYHDHPKRFTVIGLRGGYTEWCMEPTGDVSEAVPGLHIPRQITLCTMMRKHSAEWRAPWVRSFPATHIHKIASVIPDTWTLVFVGRVVRDWGFWKPRVAPDHAVRGRLAAMHVSLYEWQRWQDYAQEDPVKGREWRNA